MCNFEKDALYYSSVRWELLELLDELKGSVLDVGCGDGSTLAFLMKNGASTGVGLELSQQEVEKARSTGLDVRQVDLNREDPPFNPEEFDLIILADVLEHLYDPWQCLKKLTSCLKVGGKVLLSIPNVKHYHVMRDLLFKDRWTYCKAGILDVTHVRFFTRFESISLVEGAGLHIEKVVDKLLCSENKKRLNSLLGGRLTTLLTYQYLIVATRR